MTTTKTTLRFAALIRVSTERQEQQGESLRVQRQQIERAVDSLGGQIAGWYGGQEHATPGYEKKEVDRLLSDAQRHRFDAIMVSDPDRWSRDNARSEHGLETLLDASIRFFTGETERDLSDPNERLFLGVSAVIGQYFAANQKRKSMSARIARAKRGCCTCGKKPWGRIWNKNTEEWSIDIEKKHLIEDVAKRYLAGESLPLMAAELGMKHANVYELLRDRCGDTWTQVFYPKKTKKDKGPAEVVIIQIPRLLPEETIKAIRAKLEANKTYSHGCQKYQYLLSRMVFCEHCGAGMSGQNNASGKRYYRHVHGHGIKKCNHPHKWIPADEIEELVTLHLFSTFGNPKAVEEAVKRASGDIEKVEEYRRRLDSITAEVEKIEKGRQRIIGLVVKEAIRQDHAEKQLEELKEREARLQDEKSRIGDFLSDRPTPEQVRDASERVSAQFQRLTARRNTAKRLASRKPLSEMPWEERRALCEMVFSGKTPDGDRMGVYITWSDDGSDWTFSIRGHLIEEEGLIRWSDKMQAIMREHLEDGAGWTTAKQKELISSVSHSAKH